MNSALRIVNFLFFLSVSFVSDLFGQPTQTSKIIDGNNKATVNTITTDSLCNYYLFKARQYSIVNGDSMRIYLERAETYKNNINTGSRIKLDIYLGNYYVSIAKAEKAILYLLDAERVCITTKNERLLPSVYEYMPSAYYGKGDFNTALIYATKYLKVAEQYHDTTAIITAYFTLINGAEIAKDTSFIRKNLEIATRKYSKFIIGNPRFNVYLNTLYSWYYYDIGQYTRAFSYSKEALRIIKSDSQVRSTEGVVMNNLQIANIYLLRYMDTGGLVNLDSSQFYVNVANLKCEKFDLNYYTPDIYLLKLKINFFLRNYRQAIQFGKIGITYANKLNHKELYPELYEYLCFASDSIGDTESSIIYLKELIKLKKNTNAESKTTAFAKTALTLDIEKNLKDYEKKLSEKDTTINKKNIYILISIGVIIIVILFVWFRSIIKEKKRQKIYLELLIEKTEIEKQLLSQEIHDNFGQGLLLLNAKSENKYIDIIQPLIEEVRSISRNLSPVLLDNINLNTSVSRMIDDVKLVSNIFFTYDIADKLNITDKKAKLNIYRIIQEAISNIIKHSSASNARITIFEDNGLIIVDIKDNGLGYNPKELYSKKPYGVISMQQRANIINAVLKIESNSKGTHIELIYKNG